jgi:opacity protein-like surface antigen
MAIRDFICAMVLALTYPIGAAAQDRSWVVEGTLGYAGFVDDATKNYPVVAGSVRRYLTDRVSVGPEIVFMHNSSLVTDRHVMATGNVVFDVYPTRAKRLSPFIVGGFGVFSSRDQVRNGPFWSSDPAFTAGAGVRATVTDRMSVAAEYRVGWEPHHRITGTVGFRW